VLLPGIRAAITAHRTFSKLVICYLAAFVFGSRRLEGVADVKHQRMGLDLRQRPNLQNRLGLFRECVTSPSASSRKADCRRIAPGLRRAAGIPGHWARSRLASACAVVTRSSAVDGVLTERSGPGRSRAPAMTAPNAKMPAVHQNAVS
jgi:hypothetical protein